MRRISSLLLILFLASPFGFRLRAGEEGTELQLTTRAFRRPKDMFRQRNTRGKFMYRYYEAHKFSREAEARALLDREEQRRQASIDPIEQVSYDVEKQSALLYLPEGFDPEDGVEEWGLFIHLQSADEPKLPQEWTSALAATKMIYVAPKNAGKEVPDVVRMSLIFDAIATVREAYPDLDDRQVLCGLGEAGIVALLTVSNFPDFFKKGGVIADNALIVGGRHIAGYVDKGGKPYAFDEWNKAAGAEDGKSAVYKPLNAPYIDQAHWDKVRGRRVRYAFAITSGKGAKRIQEHWEDWENHARVEMHPFYIGSGRIPFDAMEVMIKYTIREKIPKGSFVPPEGKFELRSKRYPEWK